MCDCPRAFPFHVKTIEEMQKIANASSIWVTDEFDNIFHIYTNKTSFLTEEEKTNNALVGFLLSSVIVYDQIKDPIMLLSSGERKKIHIKLDNFDNHISTFVAMLHDLERLGFVLQNDEELRLSFFSDKKYFYDENSCNYIYNTSFAEDLEKEKINKNPLSSLDDIKKIEKIHENADFLIVGVMASASKFDNCAESIGKIIGKNALGIVNGGKGNEDIPENGMLTSSLNAKINGAKIYTVVSTPMLIDLEGHGDHPDNVIIVKTMIERMKLMYKLSDIITVIKGGMGTVQETFMMIFLNLQNELCGKIKKPIIIFNDNDGHWNLLIEYLKKLHLENEVVIVSSPEEYEKCIVEFSKKKQKI